MFLNQICSFYEQILFFLRKILAKLKNDKITSNLKLKIIKNFNLCIK